MKHFQLLLATAALLVLITSIATAQVYEDIDPTVSQFQIVRGGGDPGYNGDLDFSIPLMTVYGRGGLNFDIILRYIHGNGVPASESASWVGLGWNIDLPQITCSPNYDPYIVPENVLASDAPDTYYLTIPGISTPIRKFGTGEWLPLNWSALSIDAEPDNTLNPESATDVQIGYKKFTVRDVNGTTYVFSHRLKTEAANQLTHLCHPYSNGNCKHDIFPGDNKHDYFYVYKITAILGSNYVDGNDDDIPQNGGEDQGDWIKFEYSDPIEFDMLSYDTNKEHHQQINHLEEIKTPINRAIFVTDDQNTKRAFLFDGRQYLDSTDAYLPVLEEIQLEGGMKVSFVTSNSFGWLKKENAGVSQYLYRYISVANSPLTNELLLRLRLDELKFSGSSVSIPAYKFEYYDVPSILEDDDWCYLDPWGLLDPGDDPGQSTTQKTINQDGEDPDFDYCWMLKNVTYPTGSTATFEYETDRYQRHEADYDDDDYLTNGTLVNYMGGVRLKRKTIINYNSTTGDPDSAKYDYDYASLNTETTGHTGVGFLSGKLNLNGSDYLILGNSMGANYSNDVHYPDVKITRPDSSYVIKYYTSAFTGNGRGLNINQAYEKIYENITTEPDPYIESIDYDDWEFITFFKPHFSMYCNNPPPPLIYNRFYQTNTFYYQSPPYDWCFYDPFHEEAEEFDDYFQPLLVSGMRQYVALYSNQWKRGHLVREEFYNAGGDSVQVSVYHYEMEPLLTERYKYAVKDNTVLHEKATLLTSGWAKLKEQHSIAVYGASGSYQEVDAKTTFEYNDTNGLVNKTEAYNSSGEKRTTTTTHAFEEYPAMASEDVHMLSQIAQQSLYYGVASYSNARSSSVTSWSNSWTNNPNWAPVATYQWKESAAPGSYSLPDFNFSNPPGNAEWIKTNEVLLRNEHGQVMEEEDALGTKHGYRWGHESSWPISMVSNSDWSESSFTSFADGTGSTLTNGSPLSMSEDDRWTAFIDDPNNTSLWYFGGYGSILIEMDLSDPGDAAGVVFEATGTEIEANKTYTASTFVSTYELDEGFVFIDYSYKLSGQAPEEGVVSSTYSDVTGGEWEFLKITFTTPPGSIDWIRIRLGLTVTAASGGGTVEFEELRFHPSDAIMVSRTFNEQFKEVIRVSDASHHTLCYDYDGLGRLKKIFDLFDCEDIIYHQKNLTEYSYYYSRTGNGDEYEYTDPNSITTTTYQTYSDPVTSRSYYDAIGRLIQTQQKTGTQDIVTATEYDSLNRVAKGWKPYQSASNHQYEPDYNASSSNPNSAKYYYSASGPGPDAGGYPYINNQYYNDPLDRIEWTKPEGAAFQNGHYLSYSYDANDAGEVLGYSAATLFKNSVTDENGNTAETFTDILGNQLLTRQYENTTPLDTRFYYDIVGNLTYATDPSGKITEYQYNTLGQLTAKTTPDLDGDGDGNPLDETLSDPDLDMIYDLNGNVRFSQNPNQKQANQVYFYQYDPHNRPVKEGIGDLGSLIWSDLESDPATIRSFENAAQTYTNYHYDAASAAYPDARNLHGNLSYVEFKPDVDNQAQFTYYSYNNKGLTEWAVYDYENIADKKISYEYNLTGAVTHMGYEDMGSSETFYLWYDYNELGQLSTVCHNTTASKPALKSVEYTYWPTGAVMNKKLSEQSAGQFAEVMDYFYTPRDWLRGINAENDVFEIDPGNPADAFAMLLNYHDGPGTARYNGDIIAASYFTNRSGGSSATPPGSRFHRYIFSYDDLSRLTGAEYRYSDSNTNWNANTANAFDLSSVSFDNVGNITSLARKDESGSGAAFNYHYKNNNTDWLEWVENLRSQGAGNYNYDGNGNLIQDVSKELVNINYDYRNLPTKLEFNLAQDLLLNISDPISGVRLFRALNTITTQNSFTIESGGDVTMQAGSQITLAPGFHAQSGSDFHAEIDPNISSEPGNAISYTYNQAGSRIAKNTSDNVTLHYIRDINGQTVAVLDENGSPLFYNIADAGKLVPDGGGGDVGYYYLTDHLGSVRVTIQEDGTVVGHTDYYPFGMQIPGRVMSSISNDFYKYNGKQLDDEYGLNWLDYGWRLLDPEVGRWWSVDPLAGKYPSLSPYVYAANNPLFFIDPNGQELSIAGDSTEVAYILRYISGLSQEEFAKRYSVKDGVVSFNTEGLDIGGNEGLKLLSDLITSSKNYLFEMQVVTENDVSSAGLINYSDMPRHPFANPDNVPTGYNGYILLGTNVSWLDIESDELISNINIAFHELAENYSRTEQRFYYINKTFPEYSAHFEAERRQQVWLNQGFTSSPIPLGPVKAGIASYQAIWYFGLKPKR